MTALSAQVYFAELTQPSAQQQSLWFNTTIESVGSPIEERALSTLSRISVDKTQNMLGYCHHVVPRAHQIMVWKDLLLWG